MVNKWKEEPLPMDGKEEVVIGNGVMTVCDQLLDMKKVVYVGGRNTAGLTDGLNLVMFPVKDKHAEGTYTIAASRRRVEGSTVYKLTGVRSDILKLFRRYKYSRMNARVASVLDLCRRSVIKCGGREISWLPPARVIRLLADEHKKMYIHIPVVKDWDTQPCMALAVLSDGYVIGWSPASTDPDKPHIRQGSSLECLL